MKKIFLMALCLCVLWAGCASPGPSPITATPSVSTQIVSLKTKAADSTLLLERSYPQFSLTLPDAKAAQVIEADLTSRIDKQMAVSADLESYALEEHTEGSPWTTWFARLEGYTKRLDSQVFSLYFEYSEFTGGNHPTLATNSVSYDCTTGKALELTELLEHSPAVLPTLVNAALALQAENLYDDYEALVGKAFSDGTVKWYLSDEGLCFHFAPYAIGPYSAGVITATVPYEQLTDILLPQYLPA